ncbi:manganese catalase family protein [Biomaibacter acetigenes]|jgi:spore coat protein JC|uniref:Manganese catalase family protein n=1 Tax=Biomaibacter acetigenes TaxID=2316383 RepID=A0A3G2R604_9FIRM|nr:manganese catalase family protein [Biomaibacter acetigenes]AYO30994.1 manganese catalase family protein [Biomaibacter acetigenes]MDN5302469.1 spore coat protein [Thermoanaerobacteraceae bacterium]
MWYYEKKLEYPANVSRTDMAMAKYLFAQYGGPDSELSAAVRYLTQRYTMPIPQAKAVLTDIGTEELAHWEIIGTLIYKLTDGATPEQLRRAGMGDHYAQHDNAPYPHDAAGVPWTAAYIQATGDPIADLHEDLAAEQKARTAYEHLINLTDDAGVIATLSFLREREVVHFQRFGETLMLVREYMNNKHIF